MQEKINQIKLKIIDPKKNKEIEQLKAHEVAFPDIELNDYDLNRKKTTIKQAFTVIKDHGLENYVNNLEWNKDGNITWQNEMLRKISDDILKMIEIWKETEDSELLKKIFIYIQLWGGNSGRYIFLIKNGGFQKNYTEQVYKKACNMSINKEKDSLNEYIKLEYIGISFASKHMFFWSNKSLPIFDKILSSILFGRNPNIKYYNQYLDVLTKLGEEKNVNLSVIERSIFNWADTVDGKNWIAIRSKTG